MKKLALLALAAVAALAVVPAHAATDFVANGTIAVGDALSPVGGTQLQDCLGANGTLVQGIDTYTVALPEGSPGQDITATATDATGLADVDVYFYDANCTYLGNATALANVGDESGTVPDGAAFAEMDLFTGANANVTLTVYGVLP